MKKLISLILLAWCAHASAAITFVGIQNPLKQSTSPLTTNAFTPNAGDTLIVHALAGQKAFPVTSAVGTGAGTFVLGGPRLQDLDDDDVSFWVNQAASNTSQTVTLTSTTGQGIWGSVLDYSGVGTVTVLNIKNVAAPGTGTGAVTGTPFAVPTGSVLVSITYNTSGYSAATITPTAGTNRANAIGNGGPLYSWNVQEYAGAGSQITPAATVSIGGDDYSVMELLLTPPTGVPGIALGAKNCNGSQTSATSVATSAVTTQPTGSTFAALVTNKNAALPSLSDNKGNTWIQTGQVNSFSVAMMTMYVCVNCTGGSGHVVTASWSGAASASSICVAEFTGLGMGVLDANPTPLFDKSDANSTATPPLSTTTANELVIGAMGTENAFNSTITDTSANFALAVSQQSSSSGNNAAISWAIFPLSGSAVNNIFNHSANDYVGSFLISIKQGSAPVVGAPGRLSPGVGLMGVGT